MARKTQTNVIIESSWLYRYKDHTPRRDISCKVPSVLKHSVHVGHLTSVPTADILIKTPGMLEHLQHGGDVARIPATYILVERIDAAVLESPAHIRHVTGTPLGDVAVFRGIAVGEPIGDGGGEVRIGDGRTGRCAASSTPT